ncbi:hypothetical protein [Streptomyces atratus]|uniref:hypothetical protein n=1 Tax=Streptomyces atratus TaxID=1893 RepID=UPI0032566998
MPMIRSRVHPTFHADRSTVLNGDLSPTARLVYVLLLASLDDEESGLEEIAALAGLDSADSLRRYVAELEAVGAADLKDHAGQGEVITVHETPVVPEQRTHACVPCKTCRDCSCEYMKGICRSCDAVQRAEREAWADIARWKAELAAGATYAIGKHATKLHRWNCSTLNNPDKGMERFEESRAHAKHTAVYWSRLPDLYTAEQLRARNFRRKSCAICGPDPL